MTKVITLTLISIAFLWIFTLAFAQEAQPLAPVPSPAPVNYTLPYPGILPDHPLFVFKVIRDKILMYLISNPLRKTEFFILMGDKRLNMSLFLMDKQKTELAVDTAQEAQIYLEKAYDALLKIETNTTSEKNNIKDRFEKSLNKHIEMTEAIRSRTQGETSEQITAVLEKLRQLKDKFSRNK